VATATLFADLVSAVCGRRVTHRISASNWDEHVLRIQEINCEPNYCCTRSRVTTEFAFCIASNIDLVSSCPPRWPTHRLINSSHNPSLPPSNKALAALRAALSAPFPPGGTSKSPLNFNLDVIENAPPTADQIRTMLDYLPRVRDIDDPHHVAALISSHPSAPSLPDRPHSPEGLVRLAQKSPLALKWPIVVDWTSGRATAGDSEGVKDILEYLRKKRDGEVKEEEEYKPKGWFS
jgi:hypothetical protein